MTTPSLQPRRQQGTRLFLTLAACLCAVLALPLSAQAAFPGGNGRIAFERGGDGIFSIHPRGGEKRSVTQGWSVEYSPDGRRIAYVNHYPGTEISTIYVAQADGSGARPVAPGYYPHWSPDGRSLVFARAEGTENLYTVRAEGGGERRLVNGAHEPDHTDASGGPKWSPDGRLIAYSTGNSVFAVRPTGAGRSRLMSTRYPVQDIDWAPDGRSLAVVRHRNFQDPGEDISPRDDDVVRISRSGRWLGRIVSAPRILSSAVSPDGRQLVFGTFEVDTADFNLLYSVSTRGGRPKALTAGGDPSWQPVPRRR